MNGLYNYPSSGPMGMLGTLGADQETLISALQKILSGEMRRELLQRQAQLDAQTKEINAMSAQARTVTDPVKQQAILSLVKAGREAIGTGREAFIVARNKYDFIVCEARRKGASVELIQSGFCSGMSGLGAIPAIVYTLAAVAIVAAAIAALLAALSVVVESVTKGDSIVTQLRLLLEQTGRTAQDVSSATLKTVLAIGLGLGAFFLIKALRSRGSSSTTTLELKPVSGEVI